MSKTYRLAAALGALVLTLATALGGLALAPAQAQGTGVLQISKEVVGTPPPDGYAPGDTFQYRIELSCSNLDGAGCDAAQLADPLPDPLVLDGDPSVSGTTQYAVTNNGDAFTIDFTESLEGDVVGLQAGTDVVVIVDVLVPEDASANYDGTVTNTANATQTNGAPAEASTDVTLDIASELAAEVTKAIDPGTVPGVPGQTVAFTIDSANASNASVDSLVVQDPADGAADPFEYLEVTGVASISPPEGATQVQVGWQSADSDWADGTPTAIPDDPDALLDGIPLAQVHGLRISWISEDGATIPPDAESTIVLETQTRDTVTDLPAGDTTVTNTTSTIVNLDDQASTKVTDDATLVISRSDPTVETQKSYAPQNVPSGGTSTAMISSTNGAVPVNAMVISDPGAGQPGFDEQDVTFDGFDTDSIEWPANATEASITYTYDDDTTSSETTTETNTLPGPEGGKAVTGFEITYTGPIQQNATANLSYSVTAQTLPDGSGPVTSTNSTSTEVTDANGSTADADDTADLSILPLQVDTNITKDIVREQMPGVPGSATVISFDAMVSEDSTTGSDTLQITDPSPQPPDSDNPPVLTDFWNAMDLVSIGPVEIPTNTTLTVEYWSDSQHEWVTVEAGLTSDESPFNWTPTPEERDDIAGIRLTYEPTDPDGTLPPGFEVEPYITVAQRDQLRDGSGNALPTEQTGPITYDNDVQSKVDNPDAQETPRYADDDDSIIVNPAPDGPGTDLLDKTWLNSGSGNPDDAVTVGALTDDQRDVRITWGTGGFPIQQAVIADPASPGEIDNVSTSVYDAFDLVAIKPINAGNDPMMTFDAVTGIELYVDANGDGDGNDPGDGWTDIADDVCGADGSACDGVFPGYTLDPDEQGNTLGVRLTFEESPTRADRITNPSTDPPVGSGVANSDAASRPVDLTFQIRQTLRSDPEQPVLGTQHDYAYNTGQPGLVDNTASLTPDDYGPSTDDARITITDSAVNAELTKQFDADTVGLPPPDGDTPPEDYPLVLATLTATNTTPAKVSTLQVTDAVDNGPASSNTFDVFDLQQIVSISVPAHADADLTEVFLTENGAEGDPLTIAEATALRASDLADVTRVRVLHHSPDGTLVAIEPNARSVVELSMRLRPTLRSDGTPVTEGQNVLNIAQTNLSSPEDDASANANDQLVIEQAEYGVEAGKTIDPAERFENESRDYTVHLQGQPKGNVRTRMLTMTDTTETFWNAFDFDSFRSVPTPEPVAQIKTDALVGVTYELNADGDPAAQCNGSTDLDPCWEEGDWTETGGGITPELPDDVSAGDVRGLRFTFQNADGSGWERPANPIVPVEFSATMRDTLIIGPNGEDNTVPVPTTQPGQPTAPGEEDQGRTTDSVDVHATGTFNTPDGGTYESNDSATDGTLRKHLTNEVSVVKTPGRGNDDPPLYLPDAEIPYEFTITNTGTWPQTNVTITDRIQTNENGSMLVEPRDDNGDPDPDYTFTLVDANGNPKSTDGFAAELNEATGILTVTPPPGFVLQPGDVLTVEAPLIYQPGLKPGTHVHNSVTVTDARTYDVCESTRRATIPSTTTNVKGCTSSTVTEPLPASPIRVAKSVKGEGAGLPDAAPGDANYDDLGVLVDGGAQNSACEQPNAPSGFYTYPCQPITRPGGTERWQIRFTNSGNTTAGVLSGIDVLPHPGDTGVIVPSNRDSEWTPTLLGNFTSDGEPVDLADDFVSFYYLETVPDQACNEADIFSDTDPEWSEANYPGCFDEVENRNWVRITPDTTPAELSEARAIKGVIDYSESGTDDGLHPLETKTVTFDTQTPWAPDSPGALPPTPIAWNSVAVGARATAGNDVQRPTNVIEPRKVGVATPTGELTLEKVVDVPDGYPEDALPGSYDMQLTCDSGPEEDVPVVDIDGNDRSQVTVPADRSVTVNDDGNLTIPWGADCTATEDPVPPGVTVSWNPPGADPISGEIEATRDFAGRDDIVNPAWPDPVDPATITATNTYELAGFRVYKTVFEGGAENQDGEPIEYDRTYDFATECTYDNGEETVTVLDEEFTLADGENKEFNTLPTGSECTVTETTTGGAASTDYEIAQNGVPGGVTDGTTAEFTLVPNAINEPESLVAFQNHYTTGSVDVTKNVDGAGQWATDPFEVEMVCTLDGVAPNPVFEDTHTFTPPLSDNNDTWHVENLPTGAECTVTETQTGGANAVTIDPASGTVTVGADAATPAEVNVTNTFQQGQVRARKLIAGLAGQELEQARDHTYVFSLACTRDVNGENVNVDIPNGPAREVTPAESPVAVWNGLPVGADCTVTEVPQSQFPDTVDVVVVPGSVTVRDGSPVARATVMNVFETAPLTVEKFVTGDASEYAADDFDVEIACSFGDVSLNVDPDDPDAQPGPYDLILAADESFTTADLPVGSDCKVTETDTGNATSTTITGDGEVTIGEDGTTATITNQYDNAGFVISKVVDPGGAADTGGDPITYDVDYTFDATCVFNGETVLDEEVMVHAGASEEFDGVPVGSECTVTEIDTGGAKDTTIEVTQDGDTTPGDGTSATFALTAGTIDLDAVTTTNAYGTGALRVKKVVAGPGAGDAVGPYRLRVRCTLDDANPTVVRDETNDLAAGDAWTIEDLPVSAECTVTEPRAGGADEVTIDPGTVTVRDAKTVKVRATNTFDPSEGSDGQGGLQIKKTVTGRGADNAHGPYTVRVRCILDGKVVHAERHDLDDGDTWQVGDLPARAKCKTTEPRSGGADDVSIDPGTVTVRDGRTVNVAVTNRFGRQGGNDGLGVLRVEKIVDGADDGSEPYELRVRCVRRGVGVRDATHQMAAGDTWTVDDLPEGAQCTVTEPDSGGADEVSFDPGTVTVRGGEGVDVRVTNTFDDDDGDIIPDTGSSIGPIWALLSVLAVGLGSLAIYRSRQR